MDAKTATDIVNLNFAYSLGSISLKKLIQDLPNEPQRFYMFGVPTYNNLGDQAIAYAEKAFSRNIFQKWLILKSQNLIQTKQ